MKFKVGDVVREKGKAKAPEMKVVLEEKDGKVTCNSIDQNGNGQIWEDNPDNLELVRIGISIDLDSMTRGKTP